MCFNDVEIRHHYQSRRFSLRLCGRHGHWVIATSQHSDSSAGGIQTDDLDLDPGFLRRRGDVWLVLERMYAHSSAQQVGEERFAVELFVDQPGAVEWGGWRGWED